MIEDDSAAFAPCTHWVREGQTYAVDAPGADQVFAGDQPLPQLKPAQFVWTVRNAVGRCKLRSIQLKTDTRPQIVSSGYSVEVIAKRFATPDEQYAFVQKLLSRIARYDAIFARSSTTEWRFHRADSLSPPALVAAVLAHGSALQGALATIVSEPAMDCKITAQRVPLSTHGHTVTADAIASADGHWQTAQTALPPSLKNKLPREAWGTDTVTHFDTPENQLVSQALGELLQCASKRVFVDALQGLSSRERAQCEAVLGMIERVLKSPVFSECSRLQDTQKARLLAARRQGYQQFLQWLDHLGQNLWAQHPHLSDAASLRDASTLYEYWCLFALAESLSSALEAPTPTIKTLANATTITLTDALALQYNRDANTYSGTVKPDFVLTDHAKPRWVFDAKMRVQSSRGRLDPSTDDLHKMHAYRDALGVAAAVCLYPGDQSIFWQTDAKPISPFRLTSLVRNNLQGIGALGFNP